MEKRLLKAYLQQNLINDQNRRGENCPDSQTLLTYLKKGLSQKERNEIERHLCQCRFCLNQISTASEATQKYRQKDFEPIPESLIAKIKTNLGINTVKSRKKNLTLKKGFFLAGTVIFFILSFLIPGYFIQFLVGALILGIRWSFESKSGQTLIMILDAWRKHSHNQDDKIAERLKSHFD